MKLLILFEDHDCIPPKLLEAIRRGLIAHMEYCGVPNIAVETNKMKEMDSYQAWFNWNEERLAREDTARQVADEAKGG